MTRKIFSFILTFLVLIIVVSTANAQTSTTTSSAGTVNNASRLKEQTKAMIAAKREEFKTKLLTIRNEKKKNLVERIDTKLSEVNKKHTDRFLGVLSKLQAFINKISQTATNSKIISDIATAQAAIDSAKTAVATQAAKTYIIQITDETKLRLDVGTTTSQLRQDLMAAYKTVIDAKQAVQDLRKDKVMMKKEATSSAKL